MISFNARLRSDSYAERDTACTLTHNDYKDPTGLIVEEREREHNNG